MDQFDQQGDANFESNTSGAIPPVQSIPGDLPPHPSQAKTSAMAVWSLVLGICSILLCFGPLTAIPGLILGIIATGKIGKNPLKLKGGGLATGGIITSAIGLVVIVLPILATIMLPAVGRAQSLARDAACRANLNAIGKGYKLYEAVYEQLPRDFDTLIKDGVIGEGCLSCPFDGRDEARSYIFRGNDLTEKASGSMILVHDDQEIHDFERISVLLFNGSVEGMDLEEFKEAIAGDNAKRKELGLVQK